MKMSAKRFALLVAICLGSGCNLVSNTVKNLSNEVWLLDQEKQERVRYEEMARVAWGQYVASDEHGHFGEDYAAGFVAGYTDYLFWGGKEVSSPVALACYRRGPLNTHEGAQAFREWFEGFRV